MGLGKDDVKSTKKLNDALSDTLISLKDGDMSPNTAKGIALLADKINKNNSNALEYKRQTKHENKIKFFEG